MIPGLAERFRALLTSGGDLNPVARLADDAPRARDGSAATARPPHLFLSRILLQVPKHQRTAWDFLCLLCIQAQVEQPGASGATRVHVIGPGAIRSHTSVIPAGLLVGEIPIGAAPGPNSQLSATVFRVRRSPDSRRVIAAIEGLAASLDYEGDSAGSTAVAWSIIERLELLRRAPDTSLLMGGTHTAGEESAAHYLAFFAAASQVPERVFQARDSDLCAGQTLETAGPWREQEFLLLRVGPRPERADPNRSIDELRRLHAATQSVLVETDAAEPERYEAKVARLRLVNRLTALYGRAGMERAPVVTPIAIEAAANLGPMLMGDGPELHSEFAQQMAEMRAELRHLLGVEIPAARVRLNESDMPPGSYLFMFHEVPLVMDTLPIGRGLCSATVERLKVLGFQGEPAVNPANDNKCSWVAEDDWTRLKDAGFAMWSQGEYIVLHLSACIRKNLTEFAGIQAVASLLQKKGGEDYAKIRAAPGGLSRFTGMIQALLSEEVSVRNLGAICECYFERQRLPAYEIVEEIRALEAIRVGLFGNTADTPILRLGDKFAALIRDGIILHGEAAVLALEPEPTQAAISAVRTVVGELPVASKNSVLFVDDWRMRSFVRKLIEVEFPHLWVLSRREAVAPDTRPVLATIELDEPGRRRSRR
jgi:hypothetical protein